jgi:hypothetical protein
VGEELVAEDQISGNHPEARAWLCGTEAPVRSSYPNAKNS